MREKTEPASDSYRRSAHRGKHLRHASWIVGAISPSALLIWNSGSPQAAGFSPMQLDMLHWLVLALFCVCVLCAIGKLAMWFELERLQFRTDRQKHLRAYRRIRQPEFDRQQPLEFADSLMPSG